jgi:prepilin-type N-terminal cleavage/methylation domain-containing protein
MPADRRPSRARAFTLVELLVCIVVVAVLIGLALSGLRASRSTARLTASLNELRQHSVVFSSYANDYDDIAPYFTTPGTLTQIQCCSSVVQHVLYFNAHQSWNIALLSWYPGLDYRDDLFFADDPQPPSQRLFTQYWYSSSFLASPEFWNMSRRTGSEQWSPQRFSKVATPSHKGLLLAFDGLYNNIGVDGARIAFVDGSAQRKRIGELRPGYPGGADPWWQTDGLSSGLPVMHTIDGVHGVDVDTR